MSAPAHVHGEPFDEDCIDGDLLRGACSHLGARPGLSLCAGHARVVTCLACGRLSVSLCVCTYACIVCILCLRLHITSSGGRQRRRGRPHLRRRGWRDRKRSRWRRRRGGRNQGQSGIEGQNSARNTCIQSGQDSGERRAHTELRAVAQGCDGVCACVVLARACVCVCVGALSRTATLLNTCASQVFDQLWGPFGKNA